MKETEQFSIGGYAFTLEKDASAKLQEYIGALEKHYLSQEGGKEIMEGIEERVAELLIEKCGKNGVVNIEHVQYVIHVIGRPERIEADDPSEDESARDKQPKRLFRDLENKRLGGVCAGLSAYLQIDVVIFRLAFIILGIIGLATVREGILFVGSPLLYCILWLAMPAARTAEDRWTMRGDGITVDEISENVKAGLEEIGNTAREVGKSDFFQKFGRLFLIIIGCILLIIGTSGLASISIFSFNGLHNWGFSWSDVYEEIVDHLPFIADFLTRPWAIIATACVVFLPFVGILYGGIQMIFGFKSPSWKPGLVIFVLWLIALVVLGAGFFTEMYTSHYFHFDSDLLEF